MPRSVRSTAERHEPHTRTNESSNRNSTAAPQVGQPTFTEQLPRARARSPGRRGRRAPRRAARSQRGAARGRQQYAFSVAVPVSGNVWIVRCDSASRYIAVIPPSPGNTCTAVDTTCSPISATTRSSTPTTAARSRSRAGAQPWLSTSHSMPPCIAPTVDGGASLLKPRVHQPTTPAARYLSSRRRFAGVASSQTPLSRTIARALASPSSRGTRTPSSIEAQRKNW